MGRPGVGVWHSASPESPLTGWVTIGGATLLSFVIALTGCLLVAMMSRGRVALLAAVTVVAIAGVGITVYPRPSASETPTSSQLAVIQGNVPQPGIDFRAGRCRCWATMCGPPTNWRPQLPRGGAPA